MVRERIAEKTPKMDFDTLVVSIQQAHDHLAAEASRAVNISLTLRNWLIGCYIAEYELHGEDRAKYGENLLQDLASRLTALHVSNSNRRQLYDYLKFHRTYPQIVRSVSAQLQTLVPDRVAKREEKVPTVSAQFVIPPEKLVSSLSYSKFKLLVDIDDETKRTFYEFECINGGWSVRELKRQIASLYYERSGLSLNKKKLSQMAHANAEQSEPHLAIRDPYVFEFLGIKPSEVMAESELEAALADKLQEFLIELGHGFCFEARQTGITSTQLHGLTHMCRVHTVLCMEHKYVYG
ncbi:MAG: DUF1016 family protein [Lentisphaerae bacterium]|nr:DUF1016 family protein [Lentisphaerota bacterium]